MKKLMIFASIAAIALFAACGGGGGSSNPEAETEAETAFDDFAQQFETCLQPIIGGQVIVLDAKGVEKQLSETCYCDGSGTIVFSASDDLTQLQATIIDCVTASGETYNGTITSNDGGQTINGNMTEFGVCQSASASNVDGTNCTGSVGAQCPDGGVSCGVVQGSEGDCDLSC